MDRHFSCAENCIHRYLLEDIFKEHFKRSSDATSCSTLQLPSWKKSAGIWIATHWLHPWSVFSDCFPHPLVSHGYHRMHKRFTLNVSSPSLCKVSEIYICRTFSMSRVVTLFIYFQLSACTCVCVGVSACMAPMEARRVWQVLWSWSSRKLWVVWCGWMFGTEVWSSARTLHALNHWAISISCVSDISFILSIPLLELFLKSSFIGVYQFIYKFKKISIVFILSLYVRPTEQEGNYAWYQKPSQLSGASKVTDLRRESATVTLLDQHNTQLNPKSHPYPNRQLQLSHPKSFSLQ